jgi:hypothetical protein
MSGNTGNDVSLAIGGAATGSSPTTIEGDHAVDAELLDKKLSPQTHLGIIWDKAAFVAEPLFLSDQTESQIARRLADGAATPSCVPDEVRHIGAVFAFDDSHPTIGGRRASRLAHHVE